MPAAPSARPGSLTGIGRGRWPGRRTSGRAVPQHRRRLRRQQRGMAMLNIEHLYEGAPGGRQMLAGDEAHISQFRGRYRALSAQEKARHDAIEAA